MIHILYELIDFNVALFNFNITRITNTEDVEKPSKILPIPMHYITT